MAEQKNQKDRILKVTDLSGSFFISVGEIQAVRNVSFHLNKGETLAIVGESGCGKSVLCKSIMQLNPMPPYRVKSGEIIYIKDDKTINLTALPEKAMEGYRGKEMAMIFQDPMTSLNPTMKVGKQIAEGIIKHGRLSSTQAREIAVRIMQTCGIPNAESSYDRYPHTYSGGMRQRIMISMALACNPQILIADEPTTALDVTMQAQILELMNELKAEIGTAIILVTHDLGVVARMADRIAVMYAGEIVETGPARQVFYHPRHCYTWGLLGSIPSTAAGGDRELAAIPGAPPDLFAPPHGCAFAARCLHCMPVCRKLAPPEVRLGRGHSVRCWLADPRAPKPEAPKIRQRLLEYQEGSEV